jgi:hypothetical protein
MSQIIVRAYLVDGSLQEFSFGIDFLERLKYLKSAGYRGRRLINKLITDDWGGGTSPFHRNL